MTLACTCTNARLKQGQAALNLEFGIVCGVGDDHRWPRDASKHMPVMKASGQRPDATPSGTAENSVDIVPSGEALAIAQRLLGVRSLHDVLTLEKEEAPARPLGLGLGAKYLPHSKVNKEHLPRSSSNAKGVLLPDMSPFPLQALALARPIEKQLARRLQKKDCPEAAAGASAPGTPGVASLSHRYSVPSKLDMYGARAAAGASHHCSACSRLCTYRVITFVSRCMARNSPCMCPHMTAFRGRRQCLFAGQVTLNKTWTARRARTRAARAPSGPHPRLRRSSLPGVSLAAPSARRRRGSEATRRRRLASLSRKPRSCSRHVFLDTGSSELWVCSWYAHSFSVKVWRLSRTTCCYTQKEEGTAEAMRRCRSRLKQPSCVSRAECARLEVSFAYVTVMHRVIIWPVCLQIKANFLLAV